MSKFKYKIDYFLSMELVLLSVILAVCCLSLLSFWLVVGYTLVQLKQYVEIRNSQKVSEVKSEIGMKGVIAKDQRNAEKIVNKMEQKITMPMLSSLVEQFGLEEEMSKLENNPVGMKVLKERIEPLLQQYGIKLDQFINDMVNPQQPTLLTESTQSRNTKMYKSI